MIDEGNTIPFIARYRKEATGSLNDEVLRNLDERLKYLRNLEEKKEQVISSIREQEKLTPELEKQILEMCIRDRWAADAIYGKVCSGRRRRASKKRESLFLILGTAIILINWIAKNLLLVCWGIDLLAVPL